MKPISTEDACGDAERGVQFTVNAGAIYRRIALDCKFFEAEMRPWD